MHAAQIQVSSSIRCIPWQEDTQTILICRWILM